MRNIPTVIKKETFLSTSIRHHFLHMTVDKNDEELVIDELNQLTIFFQFRKEASCTLPMPFCFHLFSALPFSPQHLPPLDSPNELSTKRKNQTRVLLYHDSMNQKNYTSVFCSQFTFFHEIIEKVIIFDTQKISHHTQRHMRVENCVHARFIA